MGYFLGTINYELGDSARATVVTAGSSAAMVQCYRNGELVGAQAPAGSGVTFRIARLVDGVYVRLLSVDADDANVDFFSEAFPSDVLPTIVVRTPTEPGYFSGDRWRVYLDDELVHDREIWPPRTKGPGGRGSRRGVNRGLEVYGSGRGNWRGLQRGFEPVTLEFETTILSPGTYQVEVATVDSAGNESSQTAELVQLDTYPGPCTDLAISSYVKGTDTLVLTFTGSPDIED